MLSATVSCSLVCYFSWVNKSDSKYMLLASLWGRNPTSHLMLLAHLNITIWRRKTYIFWYCQVKEIRILFCCYVFIIFLMLCFIWSNKLCVVLVCYIIIYGVTDFRHLSRLLLIFYCVSRDSVHFWHSKSLKIHSTTHNNAAASNIIQKIKWNI